MKYKVNCEICNKEEEVIESRHKYYKTCSYKCSSIRKKVQRIPNGHCDYCGANVFIKNFLLKNKRHFCNRVCMGSYREMQYSGPNNPNYRGIEFDQDGYKVTYDGYIRDKEHKIVTLTFLGIKAIPKGLHIHHRDANRLNNKVDNLCLLSASDHRWIHKQYGSATLWAYMNNKITLDALVEWSSDKERTIRILTNSIRNQIGVIKSGELMENQETDNHEPS